MLNHGSSPRMWGTLYGAEQMLLLGRFIPTYVGNTVFCLFYFSAFAVQPHVCGEHMELFSTRGYVTGSSPRMWGTHGPASRAGRGRRFIPTYVGNTWRRGD